MIRALDLSNYLAEQAIQDFFGYSEGSPENEAELLSFCEQNYAPMHLRRLAYRLQRRTVNKIIVGSVIADLPPDIHQLIVRKYKNRELITRISMDCNVSIARLSGIYRSVLENIQNMLLYMLTVRDVYSRIKVVNMIHVLDLRLGFLNHAPEFSPYVSRDWVLSLEICREKYRQLYTTMERIIKSSDESLHYNIIAAKLRQPKLTSKELSALCHVSQNGINRHLRTYEEEVSKFIVA